jgi:hypothetical protein
LHIWIPGCAKPRPVTLIVGFNPAAAGLKPRLKVH